MKKKSVSRAKSWLCSDVKLSHFQEGIKKDGDATKIRVGNVASPSSLRLLKQMNWDRYLPIRNHVGSGTAWIHLIPLRYFN